MWGLVSWASLTLVGDPQAYRKNTGRGVCPGSGPWWVWLCGLAQSISVSVPPSVLSCENDPCLTCLMTLLRGLSVHVSESTKCFRNRELNMGKHQFLQRYVSSFLMQDEA